MLARNEAENIGKTLSHLAEQSLLAENDHAIEVHVVANGCTDDTAVVAADYARTFSAKNAVLHVHDIPEGGKSRAWNLAVHELIHGVDIVIFVDADIEFVEEDVLAKLIENLQAHPQLGVLSGFPIKDISRKEKSGILDRFSLAVSSASRESNVINGSLYAARLAILKDIWLPGDTPGEDGFLNAMVTTDGFTRPFAPGRVISASTPTHYFKAHGIAEFFAHERRMLVGTMVNRWLFEHLWAQKRTTKAGPDIALWNASDPEWVERVVAGKTVGKQWVIPRTILLGRLHGAQRGGLKAFLTLPLRVAAVIISLFPAIAANRILRAKGANKLW